MFHLCTAPRAPHTRALWLNTFAEHSMPTVVASRNACPPKRPSPPAKARARLTYLLPSKDPSPTPRPRGPLPPRRRPGKSCCIRHRDPTARTPPTAWPAGRPPQGCWPARRLLHATRLPRGRPVNGPRASGHLIRSLQDRQVGVGWRGPAVETAGSSRPGLRPFGRPGDSLWRGARG